MGLLATCPERFCKILHYNINRPLERVVCPSRMRRASPNNKSTLYCVVYCSAFHSGRLSFILFLRADLFCLFYFKDHSAKAPNLCYYLLPFLFPLSNFCSRNGKARAETFLDTFSAQSYWHWEVKYFLLGFLWPSQFSEASDPKYLWLLRMELLSVPAP
jgi:hypothetical protein